MDSRGTASIVEQTSLALDRLASYSRDGFPNLVKARAGTVEAVTKKRAVLASVEIPDNASVVLFGSWGRQELTDHSDNDWLLLVSGSRATATTAAVDRLRLIFLEDGKAPGKQAIFGRAAYSSSLARHIGLHRDDNRNLTQRMLLMLESQPVAGDQIYQACWDRVLEGYLDESIKTNAPPRFFLNDVVRYWSYTQMLWMAREKEGGVPSRLIKTDAGVGRQEGTPW